MTLVHLSVHPIRLIRPSGLFGLSVPPVRPSVRPSIQSFWPSARFFFPVRQSVRQVVRPSGPFIQFVRLSVHPVCPCFPSVDTCISSPVGQFGPSRLCDLSVCLSVHPFIQLALGYSWC